MCCEKLQRVGGFAVLQQLLHSPVFGVVDGADAAPDLSHMSADAEVKLPLKRAQSVIRSRLQTEGWQVGCEGQAGLRGLGSCPGHQALPHMAGMWPASRPSQPSSAHHRQLPCCANQAGLFPAANSPTAVCEAPNRATPTVGLHPSLPPPHVRSHARTHVQAWVSARTHHWICASPRVFPPAPAPASPGTWWAPRPALPCPVLTSP